MPTINTHFLPATTGLDLGSPTQQWDLNAQDVTLNSVTSNTLPHATTGVINLGNTDKIAWRDSTDAVDVTLGMSGTAVGTQPADLFEFDNGIKTPLMTSAAVSPSSTGVIRLASGDNIRMRNNIDNADLNAVSLDTLDEVVVGDIPGLKTVKITSSLADATHVTTPAFLRMGNNEAILWRNSTDLGDEGLKVSSADWLDMSTANGLLLSGAVPNLRFNAADNASPMLKRNGTNVDFRLGDDSDYTSIAVKNITAIGGVTTVGNGMPLLVALTDLGSQATAIGSTTLYTTVNAGTYRLTWTSYLGAAAGVSSTVGPLTVTFFDGNSFSHTLTVTAMIPAGTFATSSTANTQLGAVLIGQPLTMYCQAASPISYTFGYASNPAATMQYQLSLRLEYLA